MYVIWLQGRHSEGYYYGESCGEITVVSDSNSAVRFPSYDAACSRVRVLRDTDIVIDYEIIEL